MAPSAHGASPVTDIALPCDFDVDWTIGFLRARHAASLESVEPAAYVRTFVVSGRPVTAAFAFDTSRAASRMRIGSSPVVPPDELRRLATRLFDLDANLSSFRRCANRDRLLGPLVAERPGIRLPRFLDPFEGVARAILGQQVSVAAARQIVERMAAQLGDAAPDWEGRRYRMFPTPGQVLDVGASRLGELGLTRAKQAALLAVAEEMRSGALEWTTLNALAPDVVQARLDQIRGIGPWTAAYLRMRVLGDRDAFPSTDLGVVKAFAALAGRRSSTPERILAASEAWRPWRAYATLHLWRSLARSATPLTRRPRNQRTR